MKYFDISEFNCKCCGQNKMNMGFLALLGAAREQADCPFVITSGYRCEKHNKEVGSTSSNHVLGVAADIRCTDGPTRFKIIQALIRGGFRRIGIAKTFIHCDCNDLPSSIWLY